MNQDQLETHVRDAIVRETSNPGGSVALWRIGERVSRTVPGAKWPALIPAVDALERRGVIVRTAGSAGQTMYRFEGIIAFDPVHQERIIFPDGHGAYITAFDPTSNAGLRANIRIPQVAG
jgi:hypothetical protein